MTEKPLLPVVAVALIDGEGRVLVQQRPPGKSMAGLWEFPGGKVESGERPEQALVRELSEELGIVVNESELTPGPFVSEPLGESHLLLLLYLCRHWTGEPVAHHATQLGWHPVAALRTLAMPPADIPLVAALKLYLAPSPS
jgi:8-oxo-dGTP diphosphatase